MQTTSPSTSSESRESSLSGCGMLSHEHSVDANFYDREPAEDVSTDTGQEDCSSLRWDADDSDLSVNLNGFHQAEIVVKHETEDDNNIDTFDPSRTTVKVIAEAEEGANNYVEGNAPSVDEASGISLSNDEVDTEFWLPPEPEDQEDDVVGSITNYDDDDDDYGDCGDWAKPSFLRSLGEEGNGSHQFKWEKIKAMDNVKNGQFRGLVSQLLQSLGVCSSGNNSENWVDIVTSLSWAAAAFVKPDANEGKAMDPDGYVRVKCVATGSRSECQLIKGLVFKKHAAHKHMPTKYKNPRLLLIYGSLGLSSGGLSSFQSMQQENENLNHIVEMIDMYQPNVILVEKSVSRDIQEYILGRGITLVYDMKLHRLERVARCIGSTIMVSEAGIVQKLKQCDFFRIEKFVEEHAVCTDKKKQSKTLMFVEGAPSRLACTILLMGANGDELKRIKCVVRCAVVMAYHLMLETSFLLDQTAMFSTISPSEVVGLVLCREQSTLVGIGTDELTLSGQKQSDVNSQKSFTLDIPICNGVHELESDNLTASAEGNHLLSFEACKQEIFPSLSLSSSIQEVMNDSFARFYDPTECVSYPCSDGTNHNGQTGKDIQISSVMQIADQCGGKPNCGYEKENLVNNVQGFLLESSETRNQDDETKKEMKSQDEITSLLDSESILVLVSSRNASRGTICDHNRFSHIKFYRNFDVPLGKFLEENLLNQRLKCKTCEEPPEAHFFYYAHHNKQLTIQVRCLPARRNLPGEAEGKIWMWSRCGRCKHHNGSFKSTKRVLISAAARSLSFGKFLELSFSNHSSLSSLSSCGHSFHKDFIYFFGLGPMVSMFKNSPVVTYSVSLPPQKMEFKCSEQELLMKDLENVHLKGTSMFLEIEKSLKGIESRYIGATLNIQGSRKKKSDILEMLSQEKSQIEIEIQNVVNDGGHEDIVYGFLRLNRVRLNLLLESCVWDQRLHDLLSSDLKVLDSDSVDLSMQEEHLMKGETGAGAGEPLSTVDIEKCDIPRQNTFASVDTNDSIIEKVIINKEIDGPVDAVSVDVASPTDGRLDKNEYESIIILTNSEDALEENHPQENLNFSVECRTDKKMSIATDVKETASDSGNTSTGKHHFCMLPILQNEKGWIWDPFTSIRHRYMEDLHRGYLPKFEYRSSYAAESTAQKLISEEGSRMHIPLGCNDYIVSDYEDEFSSIIACAITLLNDSPLAEVLTDDARREGGIDRLLTESSQTLPRIFSLASPKWSSFSSFGSTDSESIQSSPPLPFEDSHSSSFDGLDLLESLVSYGASHPEVSMGVGNQGTRKYSVVCVYASQFRQLRDQCCPSDVDYIASLSRCRNWDAKGGKSKSLFAKTLDDRFIIKEIKRTEFDSFIKFAPKYFDYMNQCYELGNQTCLAKILGVYQVVTRGTKNGKETRHDLIVMENLSYGRKMIKQYDLKGALHARFTSAANGSDGVLLDQNFVNDMNVSPLYVSRKSKRNLQRAVYNDTNFLKSVNVMDYSLLVGVDPQRRELVCGIIDYLRQYTWDKQLETWVKSSLVVPKNHLPTIISPKEYKKRFRKFIDCHFLSVPDHWCSQRPSNPCKLCGHTGGVRSQCPHGKCTERTDHVEGRDT